MSWSILEHKEDLNHSELILGLLNEAEAIIVGVGAGMTAADGFQYVGPRFNNHFSDFIEKYKWLDMFQASVFDFESLEEEWAFFSRFVNLNYLSQPLGESFVRLKEILEDKNYYILTSNADNAFDVAGYDRDKVFDVQGKYNLMQCSKGCHSRRYPNNELMKRMVSEQENMEVPSDLVPYCSKCGAPMELNRRDHDDYMVEDERFRVEEDRYYNFKNHYEGKKVLYLELGCGYMAPQVIKHKFQRYTAENAHALYVTVNLKNYRIPKEIRSRTVWFQEDIKDLLKDVNGQGQKN